MECTFCKENIDDDSFYCDMCGEEIKTCPMCKRAGKGKMCTSCGKPLISIKVQNDFKLNDSQPPGISTPIPPSGTIVTNATINAELNKSAIPQLRLINKNIKVDLKIDDNSIIGAGTGQYTSIFSPYNDRGVSGRHCQFNYDATKGWTITDLESSYGTKYNEQELLPKVPQLITDKCFLKFGDLEFYVRIIQS